MSQTNRINRTKEEYTGAPSTLCKGCGHDSITNCIVSAYYEMGVEPHMVMKFSGIGCSSKTPTYFLSKSQGFNSVHGRMPSVASGANVADHRMNIIGVSGDGDSMSIGIGQMAHLIRRNTDMIYIVENNGTYGLTKGQFSATADKGAPSKKGEINPFPVIDVCEFSVTLGATFVARSFSGDRKQLVNLLKAAISHRGTAIIDVISPCVTFNNHDTSTKSYTYVKDHDIPIHDVGYVPFFEEISVEMKDGEVKEIELHDGSHLTLKQTDKSYDPGDKIAALSHLNKAQSAGQILTGLIYFDGKAQDFATIANLCDKPLNQLTRDELNPGPEFITSLNSKLK